MLASILYPPLVSTDRPPAGRVREDTNVGSLLRPALVLLLALSGITGLVYPLITTLLAQVAFPDEANGSLILHGNTVVGSTLIGQAFDSPGYFWGRPSATTPHAYNAGASLASNLGPTNPALRAAVTARAAALRAADPHNPVGPDNRAPVPIDLVTASASGLDPHITPAAAYYQVNRVARERKLDPARVRALVRSSIEQRTFGILGEPRVNLLRLNLALDDPAVNGSHP